MLFSFASCKCCPAFSTAVSVDGIGYRIKQSGTGKIASQLENYLTYNREYVSAMQKIISFSVVSDTSYLEK